MTDEWKEARRKRKPDGPRDPARPIQKIQQRVSGARDAELPTKFVPRFWADSDQRLAVVRLIRRRLKALRDDCGAEESTQRGMLAERAAFLCTVLETKEVECCEGKGLDLGAYVQGLNALTGLLKALGLERRIKQVGGLRDYLETTGARKNGTR